jgi:hypothetical protein
MESILEEETFFVSVADFGLRYRLRIAHRRADLPCRADSGQVAGAIRCDDSKAALFRLDQTSRSLNRCGTKPGSGSSSGIS